MLVKENFLVALQNLLSNKLRTILTMLGIVVGVASLIAVFAIGYGGRVLVVREVENFGSNLIFISRNRVSSNAQDKFLKASDASFILSRCRDCITAVPVIYQTMQAQVQSKSRYLWLMGTMPAYKDVRNTKLLDGRFITAEDVQKRNKVCVIDEEMAKEFFGEASSVGNSIRIGLFKYEVVGVMKRKVSSFLEVVEERQPTVIPFSIVQKLTGSEYVHVFFVQARSYVGTEDAIKQLKTALQERGIQQDSFRLQTLKDIIEAIERIVKILSMIIGCVASVSLLVGGVGIMNIMLVAVTERTREIGLRKAIGAEDIHILVQFLAEAGLISGVGGLLGIVLGITITTLASKYAQWPPIVTFSSVVFAYSFSIVVGLFFGIYPALVAAKLQPVDALRYE